LKPFTGVDPIPIIGYCDAIRYRFASSERAALLQLKEDILGVLGDQAYVGEHLSMN